MRENCEFECGLCPGVVTDLPPMYDVQDAPLDHYETLNIIKCPTELAMDQTNFSVSVRYSVRSQNTVIAVQLRLGPGFNAGEILYPVPTEVSLGTENEIELVVPIVKSLPPSNDYRIVAFLAPAIPAYQSEFSKISVISGIKVTNNLVNVSRVCSSDLSIQFSAAIAGVKLKPFFSLGDRMDYYNSERCAILCVVAG